MKTYVVASWLLVLASGCGVTEGYPGTPPSLVMYTKLVPVEGTFVMYALPQTRQVHTLSYTPTGPDAKVVVSSKVTDLGEEDVAAFDRVFASDKLALYRADEVVVDPDAALPPTKIEDCPEAWRICGPPPSSGLPMSCLCAPPAGSIGMLQYEVEWRKAGEHAAFTFREARGPLTTELIGTLEGIRARHFGE